MDAEGWARVRAVRLRALTEAPDAFGTTLAEDECRSREEWRARLEDPDAATFLASSEGHDLGLATGSRYHGRTGAAGLFGMWVDPAHRGRGIGDALVDAVVAWARASGYERVLLDVANENPSAIRLYARKGFHPTGLTGSLPPPREHVLEHERALELRPSRP